MSCLWTYVSILYCCNCWYYYECIFVIAPWGTLIGIKYIVLYCIVLYCTMYLLTYYNVLLLVCNFYIVYFTTGTRIPNPPLFPHLVPPAIMVWIFVWKYIFEPFIHILQHFVLQLLLTFVSRSSCRFTYIYIINISV